MKKALLSLTFLLLVATSGFSQFNFEDGQKVDDTADNPTNILVGDLNNDTYDDFVVTTRGPINSSQTGNTIEVYINNRPASNDFTKTLVTNTLDDIFGADLADFNGDGFLDIAATGVANGTLAWYPNNMSGMFTSESVITSDLGGPVNIVAADINNDSNIDIVVSNFSTDDTVWFSNDGSGSFSAPNTVGSSSGGGTFDLDVADYDMDGDLDVVVGYFTSGDVEIYDNNLIQNSSVSFTAYDNLVEDTSDQLYSVQFADVDDDGELEIVKSDRGGQGSLKIYERSANSTSATFTENSLLASDANDRLTRVVVEDFDGDGFNDIIYANAEGNGDVKGFVSDDSGGFGPLTQIDNTQGSAISVAAGDFDKDGFLDILSTDSVANDITILINAAVLGIEDYAIQGIKIYPNPASTSLNFSGLASFENSISVFNAIGQKIMDTAVDLNNQIDVSSLARGLYFLKFENSSGTHKFIKN